MSGSIDWLGGFDFYLTKTNGEIGMGDDIKKAKYRIERGTCAYCGVPYEKKILASRPHDRPPLTCSDVCHVKLSCQPKSQRNAESKPTVDMLQAKITELLFEVEEQTKKVSFYKGCCNDKNEAISDLIAKMANNCPPECPLDNQKDREPESTVNRPPDRPITNQKRRA
jgi:hypothetical protein